MLIEEFASAMMNEDLKRLKEIASVLSQFKGYSQCVDAYIDQSQAVCYRELLLFCIKPIYFRDVY